MSGGSTERAEMAVPRRFRLARLKWDRSCLLDLDWTSWLRYLNIFCSDSLFFYSKFVREVQKEEIRK